MSQFYNQIAEKYDFIFPLSPAHKTFFASELHGKTILDVGAALILAHKAMRLPP